MAIRIADTSKNQGQSLYDELKVVNNLEVVNNNIVDLHQDLEAEA
ncbi:hypothetical protein [Sphingobacterium nematocida]|nr:hypothetical protein [Sphingobacterium nematocida]